MGTKSRTEVLENSVHFVLLYFITALAEIAGCYSVYAWLRAGKSALWLLPGAACLFLFAWLLTLHPAASGRVYAAYGGVYILSSVVWLWLVDGVRPDKWDVSGSLICLTGAAVIYFGPRG